MKYTDDSDYMRNIMDFIEDKMNFFKVENILKSLEN